MFWGHTDTYGDNDDVTDDYITCLLVKRSESGLNFHCTLPFSSAFIGNLCEHVLLLLSGSYVAIKGYSVK